MLRAGMWAYGRGEMLDASMAALMFTAFAGSAAPLAQGTSPPVPPYAVTAIAGILTAAGWMGWKQIGSKEMGFAWTLRTAPWTLAALALALPGAALWAWTAGGDRGGAPDGLRIWLALIGFQLLWVALPEELLFRGALQGMLRRGDSAQDPFPIPLSVICSGILFALVHVMAEQSVGGLRVFAPGILFGVLRERTGSLLAPILVHAVSNAALAVFLGRAG